MFVRENFYKLCLLFFIMKLIPNYSYEFNCVLNSGFDETEQIKNFASTISDKDRFLVLLSYIEKNKEFIEKHLGFELKKEYDFYVVRAEKFKSFSEPITVEYSILPEEMILFLLKEIVKTSCQIRFPDEVIREQYVNSFVDYFCINADLEGIDFVKFGQNLHIESQRLHTLYQFQDIDFSSKTMKEYVEAMFEDGN